MRFYKKSKKSYCFIYEFIQNLEYYQMSMLGLNKDECDNFVSQIKHDKKKIYDPNLLVKIPFSYNKFNTDIYSDKYRRRAAKERSLSLRIFRFS